MCPARVANFLLTCGARFGRQPDFVEPLAQELTHLGLEIWLDKFILMVGDSLQAKVEEGLRGSRFGIVIISPSFFAKDWPREELDGLFALQMDGASRILPVWHRVTKAEVLKHSPILASKFALQSADGVKAVAQGLVRVIKPDALRFEHTSDRLQATAARLREQLEELAPTLRPEIVIDPAITPTF